VSSVQVSERSVLTPSLKWGIFFHPLYVEKFPAFNFIALDPTAFFIKITSQKWVIQKIPRMGD
jgi:hypothetical protein